MYAAPVANTTYLRRLHMLSEMTPEQFDTLAGLIRPRDRTRTAARRVLVEGLDVSLAAAEVQMAPNLLSKSLHRFRSAHRKIIAAYLPSSG